MKFIGRQRELESLEREYQKDSSFVVSRKNNAD